MTTAETSSPSSTKPAPAMLWAGRILTALPTIALVASSMGKLTQAAGVIEMLVNKFHFPANQVQAIGAIELFSAILFAIPRTSALGAILITAYLGGAVCTHLHMEGTVSVPSILLAAMAWGGLYFRDERVRALLPLRKA